MNIATSTLSALKTRKGYKAQRIYSLNSTPMGTKSTRKFNNYKALHTQNAQIAFQYYSGKGNLHDLRRNNFKNFLEYSDAKQAIEKGQFFTPDEICRLIVEMLEIESSAVVADICSGKGSFFNYLPQNELYGVEVDKEAYQISKRLFPKASIQNADMRKMEHLPPCDYIVGNPPFDIPFYLPKHPLSVNGKVLSQSFYLKKCFEYLKVGAFLGFICPYFQTPRKLTANYRVKSFFWKHFDVIAVINLPKGVFRETGTNIQTKILILQKKKENMKFVLPYFQSKFGNREQILTKWRNSEQYRYFKLQKRGS